jgi:basic membrane protein A and related proteins
LKHPSGRHLVALLIAGSVFASAAILAGCSGGSPAAGDGTLTVGFIYVVPRDDFGYNQAHAAGAQAVRQIPGVEVREEERVPDTDDVRKTMKSMIELDGAKLLFPTSFNYFDPHVLAVAQDHPDVTLFHCGGLWDADKHPANVGSFFGYIDECQYLSGIVAGHTTRSKKLGFVAGKPIPQVLRNVNAFALGARSVDPTITCFVIFTGDWSVPVKEAEAATNLINQGVDVLTCHVNSPKIVIESAERRGIYTCGYHCNQSSLAPKGYLTGSEWNWAKVYTDYVNDFKAGKKMPNLVRGGLKEGIVKTSPYGPAVSDVAKKDTEAAKAKMLEGTFVIFKGPLKDNTGKIVIEDGQACVQTALDLEKMNYLVEGVVGR